jgi:hypothetical protein
LSLVVSSQKQAVPGGDASNGLAQRNAETRFIEEEEAGGSTADLMPSARLARRFECEV